MTRFKALALSLALTFMAGAAQAQDEEQETIRIGYFNWEDAMFTTNVVRHILTEEMNREVELVEADPGAIYQGVAQGDIDFHTDAWLPETHADYYDEVAQETTNAGAMYTNARLGWVVPDYIPEDELNSMADLQDEEIMERLDGQIVGIDPGAGLTRLSQEAMSVYGLEDMGYELQISSSAGMAAALQRAIEREEWIVVTGWSPHWKFARWDLRYLEDPEGVLAGLERGDILMREGFYNEEPEIYALLDRMTIPIEEVEAGMARAEESSYEEAAQQYVQENEELVNYWVTGEFPSGQQQDE